MNKYPLAILFDLDDTLISFDGASEKAWDKCCGDFIYKHTYPLTKDELLAKINNTRKWYWGDPERHKVGRENMINARREIVKIALAELNISDAALSNEFADNYSSFQNDLVCLFPNTISTLNELKSLGIRMGLITNGSSVGQRTKLSRFGLEDFFEIILIDQELGYGKPDTKVYEYALNLLGLNVHDVWMVGDNLVWDIQSPQSVGIYSVWNDYRKSGLPRDSSIIPDKIISKISELLTTAL